jgi:shikimate dehydrogenase
MRLYGLIGYPLAQSFSKKYFTDKFLKEEIRDAAYELFELESIDLFPGLISDQAQLRGLNVTIPYKEKIIPFLTRLDEHAAAIGACNCIKISNDVLTGFNTDAPAFEQSLMPQLQPHHKKGLILGTGGASKAVAYVLKKLAIEFEFVSRNPIKGQLKYQDLTKEIIESHNLIINTTPLGSFPKTDTVPDLPFEYITNQHYLYDLVYNPPVTLFLQKGKERGAAVKNGYDMLVGQAERSWEIWNA